MPGEKDDLQEPAMMQNLLQLLYGRRRCAVIFCLAVVVPIAVCLAAVAIWIAIVIIRTPSDETRIQVATGLIDCSVGNSDLPVGWEISSISPHYDIYDLHGPALGGVWIGMRPIVSQFHAVASHQLFLYRTHRTARFQFKRFPLGSRLSLYGSWQPLDLTEVTLSADEYRAACADHLPATGPGAGDKRCAVKARYGQFLIAFDTDVSSKAMSMEEMIRVLQAIDVHMLQCIESFSDQSWEEY